MRQRREERAREEKTKLKLKKPKEICKTHVKVGEIPKPRERPSD